MKPLYNINNAEPDMRQELINTFEGKFPEEPKAQPGALRRMRRDDDDNLIKCACVSEVTTEPDKDKFCNICWGEGFVWDEVLMGVYKVIIERSVGLASGEYVIMADLVNIALVSFCGKYNALVRQVDNVVEMVMRIGGTPRTL